MPGGPNFWPFGYGVTEDPNLKKNPKEPEFYGPYLPPNINTFEWSQIYEAPAAVASKVANQARLLFSSNVQPAKQAEPTNTGPAWYDIPGRISAASSAVSEGLQSTLLKVIILVTIVGVVALFGMSYIQAKGTSLAK